MVVWHGRVIDGITLAALMLDAPREINWFKLGQGVRGMASGRVPSIITRTTGVIVRRAYYSP
jgi:hypothetical protein